MTGYQTKSHHIAFSQILTDWCWYAGWIDAFVRNILRKSINAEIAHEIIKTIDLLNYCAFVLFLVVLSFAMASQYLFSCLVLLFMACLRKYFRISQTLCISFHGGRFSSYFRDAAWYFTATSSWNSFFFSTSAAENSFQRLTFSCICNS